MLKQDELRGRFAGKFFSFLRTHNIIEEIHENKIKQAKDALRFPNLKYPTKSNKVILKLS